MNIYTFSITRQDQGILHQIALCIKAERVSAAYSACQIAILDVNSRLDYLREGYQLWSPRLVSVKGMK